MSRVRKSETPLQRAAREAGWPPDPWPKCGCCVPPAPARYITVFHDDGETSGHWECEENHGILYGPRPKPPAVIFPRLERSR